MRLLLCWLVAGVLASVATGAAERPNILVILTDDQGVGDLSAAGTPDLRTPHMDRLYREGVTFRNFRTNSTVCSPTRAALLTGRNPDRAGVPGVIRSVPEISWGRLAPNVATLPELLRPAGYHTALVGKWHLGLEEPNLPNSRGFDLFHGFLGDMMNDYWTHERHGNLMRRNREAIAPKGHATDLFTDWACAYLEERAAKPEQPFFLFLAYTAPHNPIQPPPDVLARVREREPAISEKRAKLVALIEHLDDGIGRVLATLDRTRLAANTLVIFTSDNGGELDFAANNGAWRGGKRQLYEGGLRVPFAGRWPGRIAAGTTIDMPAQTIDLFATACEVAGVEPPDGTDGVSLLATMRGDVFFDASEREFYFVCREGNLRDPRVAGGKTFEALIRGDWKIVEASAFAPRELFNLRKDPGETTNLADEEPEIFADMAVRLMVHVKRAGAVPWQAP